MSVSTAPLPAPVSTRARPAALATWLFIVTGLIFAMALIGAITRLTGSGLSMVEWRPLIGTLPPVSAEEWQRVFDLYRQTPEYRFVNTGMSLSAFKTIFFWEWFHRLWGRLIGVAFALPYLVFLALRAVPTGWHGPLLGLFVLGGLQGVIGMWMVESGLVDRPAVSHYRLAIHLGMAMVLYGLCLAAALRLSQRARGLTPVVMPTDRRAVIGLLALLVPTLLYGAFVAGMDAGLAYNTWPTMDGRWIPAEMLSQIPWWHNLTENTAMVQFIHRWLAIALAAAVLIVAWRRRRALAPGPVRVLWGAAMVVVLVQVALGIAALLTQLNIVLATAHQGGAFALIGVMTALLAITRSAAHHAAPAPA